MKNIFINKKNRSFFGITIIGLFIFLIGCVYLDSVSIMQIQEDGSEAPVAKAGTEATFTIKGNINCQSDERDVQFVVSVLAPISWKLRENAKVTYTTTLHTDVDEELTMSVIPESTLPKNAKGRTWGGALMQDYGVGPNVLYDMEWVTFATDKKWEIFNGDKPNYTIYIKTNVGNQNLKAYLGFFVNHTNDGISGGNDHQKVKFSDTPFEVVGGEGFIDYSSFHYNKVQPLASLQDDFVTFSYIADAFENDLSKYDEVYIEATAFNAGGIAIAKVDEKSKKTLLTKESALSQIYSLTMWPTSFFGIPEGEIINHIEYIFTNKDGSVTITQSDDDSAVNESEIIGEKDPFIFEFKCE